MSILLSPAFSLHGCCEENMHGADMFSITFLAKEKSPIVSRTLGPTQVGEKVHGLDFEARATRVRRFKNKKRVPRFCLF